jgi:heptosyltransferase-2
MEKILIFKTGYSEFLDKNESSKTVSLGDVLRTTPILHLYKDNHVTWVSDSEAFLLLENNPHIERLLPYDLTTVLQLEAEEFDTVINLEKIPGICALSDKVRARRSRYGFTFNSQTGKAEAYNKAFEVLAVSSDPKYKKENQRTAQELLFEMVGARWKGEEYILGYKPKTQEKYDIGLNTIVGSKWPTKAWPKENWDKLEELVSKEGLLVTRQDKQDKTMFKDINLYMDWINSCKTIVTNDSLGLHLALALKKRVLGLFGPTPYKEVYFYDRGEAIITEEKFDCMPCFEPKCSQNSDSCVNFIKIEDVYKKIKK